MNAVAGGLDLVRWVLAVYGVTLLVTESKIARPLRRRIQSRSKFLGELVECPMCFGFWASLTLGILGLRLWGPSGSLALDLLSLLLTAAAGSGVCWVLHILTTHLGANEL